MHTITVDVGVVQLIGELKHLLDLSTDFFLFGRLDRNGGGDLVRVCRRLAAEARRWIRWIRRHLKWEARRWIRWHLNCGSEDSGSKQEF